MLPAPLSAVCSALLSTCIDTLILGDCCIVDTHISTTEERPLHIRATGRVKTQCEANVEHSVSIVVGITTASYCKHSSTELLGKYLDSSHISVSELQNIFLDKLLLEQSGSGGIRMGCDNMQLGTRQTTLNHDPNSIILHIPVISYAQL